jgi:hypothetical protein
MRVAVTGGGGFDPRSLAVGLPAALAETAGRSG